MKSREHLLKTPRETGSVWIVRCYMDRFENRLNDRQGIIKPACRFVLTLLSQKRKPQAFFKTTLR